MNTKTLVVALTLAMLPGAAFAATVNGAAPIARVTHMATVRPAAETVRIPAMQEGLQFNLIDGQPVR